MARKGLRLRWHEGNRIELLQNGDAFFPALYEAIDAAQTSVHLETYIFNLDQAGQRVLEHLREACQRGVKVRVVVDGFGSAPHADEIGRQLVAMGAQYRIYRPEPKGFQNLRFNLRRLRRLHRKVAGIGGRIAFLGGINIIVDL